MPEAPDSDFVFTLCPFGDKEHIIKISELARTIWEEHFTPIIGVAQVQYMLKKFQSISAIEQQIENGFQYYTIRVVDELVGYYSWEMYKDNNSIHLSKIYILKSHRKKGLTKKAISFIEKVGALNNVGTIWLTVNKSNHIAINAYEALGFRKRESVKIDIGEGYFMDDFCMEKII